MFNSDFANNDFFFHILKSDLSKKRIEEYIINFYQTRKKYKLQDDVIIINNIKTLRDFRLENTENVFYISVIGCLLCRQTLNTFESLFIHYKINHDEYELYHYVIFYKNINYYLVYS